MADKSFGVKELNLLNASGTPTVTSPNNLNLNANTVAISTSATVGNNLTVSGQINVGSNIKIGNAGVVTATSFVGSGANLTGITAGISTDPSNIQATWKLGGGSGSGFTFTGPGQDGSEGNPDIYLVRGQRYLFDNTTLAGNHPFEFRNAANNADYTDGVSGAQNGLQYLNVQHDAPARLKYRCTIHTGSMLGDIYIIGGPEVISGVVTATTFVGNLTGNVTGTASANAVLTGSTNNTLVTVTGANAITGESTLTYNGSDTFELQPASATPAIFIGDSNRTGAGQGLAQFRGNWNGTTVARITFDTGDDTTNKDDGIIRFDTSSTGSLVERVRINRSGYLGIGNVSSPDDTVEIRTSANDQGVLIKSTGSTSNAIKFDANRSGANQGLGSIKARWNGTTVAQIYMNTGSDTSNKDDGYIIFGTESAASNGNANATERMRITSGGYVNIGGSSTQTTHLLHLQSTGDAGIHIRADSDNSGENDNPYLSMSQDGSTAQELKIGQNGDAGQNFALSLANSPFIHANHSAAYPLQLAHMDTMCVFISSRHNELGLNNYSGNTTAGMEIQNRGNDTATALKLTGHNNSGTPGAETFTQLTHIGSNLTFEIMHAGDRAFHIGSTRRIRVPGVWGVNGSSMRTVQIESDGNLCAPSSIREAKINIESISDVSWLYDFNPVTFNFRTKTEVNGENVWGDKADDGGLQYGLIADEVEAVNQDLCFYDDNKLSGIHYDRMIAPLIKALQEQKAEIDALKTKVATLEGS